MRLVVLQFCNSVVLMKSMDPKDKACALIADFGTSQFVTQPINVTKVDNPVWQGA